MLSNFEELVCRFAQKFSADATLQVHQVRAIDFQLFQRRPICLVCIIYILMRIKLFEKKIFKRRRPVHTYNSTKSIRVPN